MSNQGRVLVWFSCGAASAVAAKLTVEKYGKDVEVIYCDTFAFEHPDNRRFLSDVEAWVGVKVKVLASSKYRTILDVFMGERFLVGRHGAPCTRILKREVREDYQQHGDLHIFGMTVDEPKRIKDYEESNVGLDLEWILRDQNITKSDCYRRIREAGIATPYLYLQGYKNNNCIGCVKGGAGYWNKIRRDYPETFVRMGKIEREIGHAICRLSVDGERHPVYLDELPPDAGRYDEEPDIECGTGCQMPK